MSVKNNRNEAILTFINDVQCTYENGKAGSHLEYFNNLQIAPNTRYPASGGVYLEAKNSGTCFFQAATFKLKITVASSGVTIGTVCFRDVTANWDVSSNTNKDIINVNIDNGGDQAVIAVTVAAS